MISRYYLSDNAYEFLTNYRDLISNYLTSIRRYTENADADADLGSMALMPS